MKSIFPLIEDLSIAIDNGDSCIVAGGVSAVEKCETALKNDKIMSMRIGVDYGSHSHLMIPIVDDYEDKTQFPWNSKKMRFLSDFMRYGRICKRFRSNKKFLIGAIILRNV